MNLKESQAKATKTLREAVNRVNNSKPENLAPSDYAKAKMVKQLIEACKSPAIAAEWVGGMANNWMAKIKPGQFEESDKYTIANFKEAMGKLKETNTDGTLGALTTLGVEAIMLNRFQVIDTSYRSIAMTRASDADTQVYETTFRPGIPQLVLPGEQAPEVNLASTPYTVKNYKWMLKLNFTAEITEDDQTGEVAAAASEAAENMDYIFESWMVSVLLGGVGTYGGFTPGQAFQTYIDADGGAQYTTTGARINKITPAAVSYESLRSVEQLGAAVTQPDGQRLLVRPDTIWHAPFDSFTVDTMLKSSTWAASSNTGDTGVAGMTGSTTGSVGAHNPLQGRYTPVVNQLLPVNTTGNGGAWGLIVKNRNPIVSQEREAIQVLMEAPNAGRSFENDLVQWRVRKRATLFVSANCARLMYLGNTGA